MQPWFLKNKRRFDSPTTMHDDLNAIWLIWHPFNTPIIRQGLFRSWFYVTIGFMSHLSLCHSWGYVAAGPSISQLGLCRNWVYIAIGFMSQLNLVHNRIYVAIGFMSQLSFCHSRVYVAAGPSILQLGLCHNWVYVAVEFMSQSGLCRSWT